MCLLPWHFLVLSHSLTLMPPCEFHTSLILVTLPSWHVAPTQAPYPTLITGFLHFCRRCFATDLSKGFICRRWRKVQQSFFGFPESRCDEMHFDPTKTLVLVWLPTVHSAGLLLYLDRFTHGTYTFYILQQQGMAIYHNHMIPHFTCTVISEIDALDVVVDLTLRPCTCCLSHRQKLPNHSCSAVTHWHGVPQGQCAFAAQMSCQLALLLLRQT